MNSNYPYWKKVVWRFVRAGLAGGMATLGTVTYIAPASFEEGQKLAIIAGTAFVTGFVNAAAKAIRDWVSEGDKEATIQKLPV